MGYYLFYIFGRTEVISSFEGGLNTIICLKYENLNVYMLYILTIRWLLESKGIENPEESFSSKQRSFKESLGIDYFMKNFQIFFGG